MKSKYLLFTAFMLMQVFFISCKRSIKGEGAVVVEKRDVSGFAKIDLEIPANVTVVVADSFNCIITAQSNIIRAIKTMVKGEKLEISSEYSFQKAKVDMVVSLPAIEGLMLSGSGSIKTLNIIKSESLKLYINGSGEMYVNAETDKIHTEINGSGTGYINGSSKFHRCEINGSGDLHGFGLSCIEADVEINGSGDAEVSVTDMLNASIHGSGNIIYKSSPHLKSEIVGSGTIKKSE